MITYVILLEKLSLLVALSILSGFVRAKSDPGTRAGLAWQGFLFGVVAIIGMLDPFRLGSSLIFDGRSVVISLCTLFFGPLAGGIASVMTIAARWVIGGEGALTGSLVVVSSFMIGWGFHRVLNPYRIRPDAIYFFGFGLLVHSVMVLILVTTVTIPLAIDILSTVALPILLLYPLSTILIGKVLLYEVDILDRNRRLHEREGLFRSMFEDHKAVEMLLDARTGAIVDANTAAIDYYGWPKAVLQGMNIRDINRSPAEEIRKAMDTAAQNKANRFEFRHLRADGSIRDVEVYSSPIRYNGRELLHSIIHDVTERKEGERHRRLQSAALEAAANAIVITDKDGHIEWANPAFSKLTGFDIGDAVGVNPRDLIRSGKQPTEFYQTMWDTILAGRVWSGELVNRRRSGEEYDERMTITPVLDDAGDITHFIAIKEDVTERKRNEHLMRHQLSELERINSELDRFVYSTSHDLRAPLLSVIGLISLSLEQVEPDSEVAEYLHLMDRGIRRADDTIRSILDYSRNSRLEPQADEVDVAALAAAVIDDIRFMPEVRAVRFETEIDPALRFRTDQARLKTILHNLVTNAAKYQREEEPDQHIRIRAEVQGGSLHLSVADNGIGIPEQALDGIFDMFMRYSEKSTGSGLGLYMVRELVRKLDGAIRVESRVGVGTEFFVTLPERRHE